VLAPYGLRQRALLKRVSLRFVERPLLDDAAAIHCTSAAEQADVCRLNAKWRTVVIPLGVDTDCYTPAPQLAEPYALFLSRLHPKKGIELLLAAAAQLPHLKLVIAGSGDSKYVAQLQETARRLGIAGRVTWAGHVSGVEKVRILRSASVFVLPSHDENFGIAVAEALACGVPAVVSDQVAVASQIAQHRAGRVTRVDAGELASALNAVLTSPAERARMATAARSLAVQEFSVRSMTERLSALYESVRR
jgi:glycosyltransferase involved in cell wall biosynthesis